MESSRETYWVVAGIQNKDQGIWKSSGEHKNLNVVVSASPILTDHDEKSVDIENIFWKAVKSFFQSWARPKNEKKKIINTERLFKANLKIDCKFSSPFPPPRVFSP